MVCIIVATWSILYTVTPIPALGIRPCGNNDPSTNAFFGLWISFIVYDSTVMILTLIKAVPSLQPNVSTPLITRLLKEGVQYFVLIFLASIANIIIITVGPCSPYRAMTAVLCSHLVLNLRGSVLRQAYREKDTT